jgi:hypothetical protein
MFLDAAAPFGVEAATQKPTRRSFPEPLSRE